MSRSEEDRKLSARKNFFGSFCSPNLTSYISHNKNWTFEQMQKIIPVARGVAEKNGRFRVWIEDFQEAIRILRERGELV
jgi:hypothetical protein